MSWTIFFISSTLAISVPFVALRIPVWSIVTRMQEQKGEERSAAKLNPTAMNFTSTVSTSSSSVNHPIASKSHMRQDAVSKTFKVSCLMGRHHMRDVLENHSTDQVSCFEHCRISPFLYEKLIETTSIWAKNLARYILRFCLAIWKGDIMVADIEELEQMDARPKTQCKGSVNANERWKLHFPSRRWNCQNFWRRSGSEKTSALIWDWPHSVHMSPAAMLDMEKVHSIVRQVHGRSPTDDLNDLRWEHRHSVLCLGSTRWPTSRKELNGFWKNVVSKIWIELMESQWTSSGKIFPGLSTLGMNLSRSSSCQCTTTLYGEKEETQKIVLWILFQFRSLLADSCSDVGHVWYLDQGRNGTEFLLRNQMETGTRLLN